MSGGTTAQQIAIFLDTLRELTDPINRKKIYVNRLRVFDLHLVKVGVSTGKRYRPYHNGKHYVTAQP
jgi:hypothetical protein